MYMVITAGGTGGHIFPALSVARELRSRMPDAALLWIGTARSRERELCERYDIPLEIIDVQGFKRSLHGSNVIAAVSFAKACRKTMALFRQRRPDAVCAFGGYACAPVLTSARLRGIPYFLQEQNTIPGLVTRLFSGAAKKTYLGFPPAQGKKIKGASVLTGNPVRGVEGSYENFDYPAGLDTSRRCILICGGSQGAASMNDCLLQAVQRLAAQGMQVVWQTGVASYKKVKEQMADQKNVFTFESIDDLYPYYSRAKFVICRAGASTLSEIAFFGLPCIMIPLPWAAENHQWINAGMVETQGWGIRTAQNAECGEKVFAHAVKLYENSALYEKMSRKALDHTPAGAAGAIVNDVCAQTETC